MVSDDKLVCETLSFAHTTRNLRKARRIKRRFSSARVVQPERNRSFLRCDTGIAREVMRTWTFCSCHETKQRPLQFWRKVISRKHERVDFHQDGRRASPIPFEQRTFGGLSRYVLPHQFTR